MEPQTDTQFVHLHCHTEYSLLDGALKLGPFLDSVKASGMPAAAITDNGVMYGAIEFYLKAQKLGVKPIIGCEVYLAKDMTVKERGWDRLILLAKDYLGYQSLVKISTVANLEGFYYKPRIDLDHLEKFTEGIIAISPGGRGPIAQQIRSNMIDEATGLATRLKTLFGPDFYIGLQRLTHAYEDIIIDESLKLSRDLEIPVVATNDVYYLQSEDAYIRDILSCIQTGRILEEDTRAGMDGTEQYLKSPAEMAQLFSDIPQAVENSVKIAEKCDLHIETEQVHLPRFECPDNQSSEEYLAQLVDAGIKAKYGALTDEIQERINFELGIINKMQYAPYFLIIYDFLEFCYQNEIPVGPGRGSAAGSIVAYALNITNIDPIKYNLLFERFLNPERVSMPDIDLDFCIRRRNEVIDYIVKRYSEECVSQIVTFGTMAARGVVRDVGRVLNVPLADVDRIAKLIPSSPGQYTSIPEALDQIPDLQKAMKSSPEIKRLLDIGAKIEGQARHTSTHAAGVVISRDPLDTVVPLIKNDGQAVTQYSMGDLEKVGLLKMDILGLRNLTVMDDAVKSIKKTRGIDIDLNSLPLDNPETYDLLCDGSTIGVFQLESRGMRQLIKDMQPKVFEDIIALLALYRPGPLGSGMVSEFVSNKSGETQVKYELPELEPILNETYGMIVYQEQVMQIASAIGGFSLGQADMLRRAMGKKKKDVMEEMREAFLTGAKDRNFDSKKAEKIFELCYKFAEYGFNKSHSAAYALISYQTAYLKANYRLEYMAALLSSIVSSSDKVSLYINECRRMGIDVLGPCVNESMFDFTVTDAGIRFGLGAIKNVGEGAIESIINVREADGKYKKLLEFCTRVDLKQVNKRVVESLIKSGAMDPLGDRPELIGIYENVLDQAQILVKERANGQIAMFGTQTYEAAAMTDEVKYSTGPSKKDQLKAEKELLGLYVSAHPLDDLKEELERLPHTTQKLKPEMDGQTVYIGGILTECRSVITRNKRQMLIGKLEDLHGEVPILMFDGPNLASVKDLFLDDNIVSLKGKVRINQDELSVGIDELKVLDHAFRAKKLHVDLRNIDDLVVAKQIRDLAKKYSGTMPLYLHVGDATVLSHKKYWLSEDELCIQQIENLVGQGCVWQV